MIGNSECHCSVLLSIFSFVLSAQKYEFPLPKRIRAAVKSAIAHRRDGDPATQPTHVNGNIEGPAEDLEMERKTIRADKPFSEEELDIWSTKTNGKAKIACLVDKVSRSLFPFAFICFNIYYWVYY